ncbi:MAG: hypothetical protein FWE52_01590 [Alphaproteobacteria bacterium]|nr:hypothetical protein [Alphaproteobacteria bacterium]
MNYFKEQKKINEMKTHYFNELARLNVMLESPVLSINEKKNLENARKQISEIFKTVQDNPKAAIAQADTRERAIARQRVIFGGRGDFCHR